MCYNLYKLSEVLYLTTKNTIRLLECKLQSYKMAYWKAKAADEAESAEKWLDGCKGIYQRIDKLKRA